MEHNRKFRNVPSRGENRKVGVNDAEESYTVVHVVLTDPTLDPTR